MTVSFNCPACHAKVTGSDYLAGRKVRCPECDEMVVIPADVTSESDEPDGAGTVYLDPADVADPRKTVMLESIDLVEPEPAELSEADVVPAVEAVQPIPVPPPPKKPKDEEEDEGPPPFVTDRKLEDTEMDMTPMVDVTFLLLIFFMVTASFTLQKSMEIPLAKSDQASTTVKEEEEDEDQEVVTVIVDENNTYQVSTIDWEEEAPSIQDLHIQLRLAREGDSTGTIPTTLRVEANGEALYEAVVTALDAGPETGFSDVQLVTVETE